MIFHVHKVEAISALVSELLREPPATLRVVISTRSDPDISLSRLRIQGFVQDIRAADERFDSEETRSLLPLQSGKEPAADTVAQLQHRTGGWAAALRLLSPGLQSSGWDVQMLERVRQESQRHLKDFFMEEVLPAQSASVRQLLVKASISGRISGSLADALVEVPHEAGSGERILAQLASAGIMSELRENGRTWYQLPNEFRDLLKRQLCRGMANDEIANLSRMVSNQFHAHGHSSGAIDVALQAGDNERASLSSIILTGGWSRRGSSIRQYRFECVLR